MVPSVGIGNACCTAGSGGGHAWWAWPGDAGIRFVVVVVVAGREIAQL